MTSGHDKRWGNSFADTSGEAFGAILAPNVQLDGSIFAQPVRGRQAVWTCLRTMTALCEEVHTTHEAATGNRVYLEWHLTALGMRMDGLTVLVLDDAGQLALVTIHQRPLAAVLALSGEMARRRG